MIGHGVFFSMTPLTLEGHISTIFWLNQMIYKVIDAPIKYLQLIQFWIYITQVFGQK
jgi:hypothetical protein